MALQILDQGSSEPLKAGIHGFAVGLAAVMGLYNTAAWLRRREPHLATNALLYWLAVAWELNHVAHHVDACSRRTASQPLSHVPEPPARSGRKAA